MLSGRWCLWLAQSATVHSCSVRPALLTSRITHARGTGDDGALSRGGALTQVLRTEA